MAYLELHDPPTLNPTIGCVLIDLDSPVAASDALFIRARGAGADILLAARFWRSAMQGEQTVHVS